MVGVTGDFFVQLGILVIITALAAFLLRLIKQPQILAYVLVGVLITPVFKLVIDTNLIQTMSIMGIAFLLFIVGLEMDLKGLKNVALVSIIGGLMQITILFTLGYLIALILGFLSLEAAYIGLALAFSSTMIVMKLLSDKRELNTLHGRIIVGFLLIEDIVAIFAISMLNSINDFTPSLLGFALLKFLALFALAYIFSKYFFPKLFQISARHTELLLIMSLAVCFTFSLAFQYLGFSVAIGAFIAGVTLGNLEYHLEIISKVKSLRDFFAMIFFVSLGMGLSLSILKKMWLPFIIILAVVMIFKPLINLTICSLFKYTKKPSFLVATSLAQVGEFALIIAAQGLALGHISPDLFSLVVLITLVSFTSTSYYIQYSRSLYQFLEKPLRIFDVFNTKGLEYLPHEVKPTIVLCGHNRIGYSILQGLKKVKNKVLVVDYNPEIITQLVHDGYHCIYGDVTDEEIITRMNMEHLSLIISTVPERNDNFILIKKLREVNHRARIIVTASTIDEALELYEKGADYVILPHFLGGEHVSNLITQIRKKKIRLLEEKKHHLVHLQRRKEVGQEHPLH